MSVICNGTLKIKCDNCGHVNSFDCKDLSFEKVESHNRQMGKESHHVLELQFNCGKSNSEVKVEYSVWEYPSGAKNNHEISVEGGSVIQQCNIDVHP